MTTGQGLSTNTFGVAKWVVSADATQGTHTTIGAALTSASSGDTIWVRDGTYTENLTLKAGVKIVGVTDRAVTIVGKCSMTAVGTTTLDNLVLQTNSDYCISLSGSAASAIIVQNCYISATNHVAAENTNTTANTGIEFYNTAGKASAGQAIFDHSGYATYFGNCYFDIGSNSITSASNTATAGTVTIHHCRFDNRLTLTGATVLAEYSMFDLNAANQTCITVTSGTLLSWFNAYRSGTASALSIAGTAASYYDLINSSNTNAVTGAGTLIYSEMAFSGGSTKINVTTQTGGVAQGGVNGNAPSAGFIGERISSAVASASAVSLSTGVSKTVTSITLTAGIWDISFVAMFNAATAGTSLIAGISTTTDSLTGQVQGDNAVQCPFLSQASADFPLTVPAWRVSISTSTTYYLVVNEAFSAGTAKAYGRISGVRVG